MKLEFIESKTERTTAFTDGVLALLCMTVMLWMATKTGMALKPTIWVGAFAALQAASVFGAFAHGYEMPQWVNRLLWHPLNFLLGLAIALFAIGVTIDLWGVHYARVAFPWIMGAAFLFFVVTVAFPGTFLVFIGYEAVAMLYALGGYGWLAWQGTLPGAEWMFAGVLVTIIASVIQALGKARWQWRGWQFDHNGIFHLVQMPGVVLLWVGLAQSLG